MEALLSVSGFDWDKHNIEKNWEKHRVAYFECEEVFFNKPLVVAPDEAHSNNEKRYFALGKTNRERYLFAVFTVRRNKIRIISARGMNKKERSWFV